MALALSQIQATCVYSPPPVLAQGQTADTLGNGRLAVATEAGWGTVGSWWDARNVGDPQLTSKGVAAARLRLGLGDQLDAGLVGGAGPQRSFIAGPEVKWRFVRVAEKPGPVTADSPT